MPLQQQGMLPLRLLKLNQRNRLHSPISTIQLAHPECTLWSDLSDVSSSVIDREGGKKNLEHSCQAHLLVMREAEKEESRTCSTRVKHIF